MATMISHIRGIFAAAALCAAGSFGCSAVYPELSTPVRPVVPGKQLDPSPPVDLMYIAFESAEIPAKTPDGRSWDEVGGSAPDPFVILFVDNKELVRTPVQSNTLRPTWPDQVRANRHIRGNAMLRIEIWDANSINNHPICVQKVRASLDEGTQIQVVCDTGARLQLIFEPAHAKLGIGLYYELRSEDVFVTRVITESPAARAGVKKGDQIAKIDGHLVHGMRDGEAQSLINTNARTGVKLSLHRADGTDLEVTLKEGAMYPADGEGIPLQ